MNVPHVRSYRLCAVEWCAGCRQGIVVVVQGLQGYDVQLNNEERVRVGSRTCSEMVPSYGSHESAST